MKKRFATLVFVMLMALGLAQGPVKAQEYNVEHPVLCNNLTTDLKLRMRELWADHSAWTSATLVAAIDNAPNTPEVLNRLLRNQDQIGAEFANIYGPQIGNEVARLLREHIIIATKVVDALKSDNKAEHQEQSKLWYRNADELAQYLSGLNPHLQENELKEMLHIHLDMVDAQAKAHIGGNWKKEIELADEGTAHLAILGDTLSAAIISQHPEKFQN